MKFSVAENRQRFEIYAEDVSDEKSFLSEIVSHKLGELAEFRPFFDTEMWFDSLIIIFPQTKINDFRQFLMNDSLDSIGKLLNYFDTGIDSVTGKENSMDEALGFLPEEVRKNVINDVKNLLKMKNQKKFFRLKLQSEVDVLAFQRMRVVKLRQPS